jgi:hypothetical protein
MSKVAALRAMREAKHEGKKAPPWNDSLYDINGTEPISREPLPYWKNASEAAKSLGSTGGKSKSPAKQAAAKENGKRGGKPKRLG